MAQLTVTIIGAGISSLTLALALRRLGDHKVTILEKSHFAQEISAALFVSPNASGLLLHLGVDLSRIGANLCQGFFHIDGATGVVRERVDLRDAASKWPSPWLLAHRRDLHAELKRLVLEEGVTLELGVRVVEVDSQAAKVRLEDGRVFEGHVVVGADGNRAVSRRCIDEKAELRSWGKCCYRWLVERKTLAADPEVAHLVGDPGHFADAVGVDRKMVQYPCRDNTVLNFAAFLPEEEVETPSGDWESRGSKANLLKGFDTFAPATKKLMSYAGDDLKVWSMLDMDSLERWYTGRLVLIGDAAHPFLPFLGQGAAQAMEDAVSIALLLSGATGSSHIPELLALYDDIRRKRVEYLREQTRLNGLDEGKGKPPAEEFFKVLNFCYDYDEWDNTSARLKQWYENDQTVGK